MTAHLGQSRPPIPVRTILATIGLVLAAALALYLVVETRRVSDTAVDLPPTPAVGRDPATGGPGPPWGRPSR